VYAGCCLLGLAAGLWSEYVLPRSLPAPAPLMVLQTVAVGQVGFFLLIYPVLIVAAFLSDATASDAVRVMILEISLLPVSLACGLWLRRPRMRTVVWTVMILSVLALPAVYYVFYDFLPAVKARWLWDIAPVTLVWQNASARGGSWMVAPAWAQFAWLAVAAGGFTCHWLFPLGEKQ